MQFEMLNNQLRRQPFHPFRVYTGDGQSYEVRFPKLCLITRNTMAIGLPDKECQEIAGEVAFVSPEEIICLEVLDASAPSAAS